MPRAFVFDAYGTLFDVHAAIARHRAAAGPDADRFSETWRTKQLEYSWTLTLAGRYVDFWTLTQRALDFAFARFPSVDTALRPKLLEAYWTLAPFSDSRPILRALKARGAATAILSNGSPSMLAAAVDAAEIGAELDAVLSVDAIRVYKPRPGGLCARYRSIPHRACRRGFRLLQPLGCDGRRGLRFSHRMDQPHEQSGRICAGARRDPRKPPGAYGPGVGRSGRLGARPPTATAERPPPPARIDGAPGSA